MRAMALTNIGKRTGLGIVAHSYIPGFRKQRQEDGCKLETHLVYIESSKPSKAIW